MGKEGNTSKQRISQYGRSYKVSESRTMVHKVKRTKINVAMTADDVYYWLLDYPHPKQTVNIGQVMTPSCMCVD